MSDSTPPIILYHYPFSPYAHRVVWYLQLRGITFSQCLQPPMLPRPDVARLGIHYRRIPLLSVGRDVYLDTRLILAKLESSALWADRPRLGAASPDLGAVERLLEALAVDAGLFATAARLLPQDLPLTRDPAFQRDRQDFFGRGGGGPGASSSSAAVAVARAEATVEIRRAADMLETTLLADGRDWILATEGPTLADIEAVWVFHWLISMPGALDPAQVSARRFPRLFAWVARFDRAVKAARTTTGPRTTAKLSGERAEATIAGAAYHEPAEGPGVDAEDPVVRHYGLREGASVVVWPTDTGVAHKDVGRLVGVDAAEIVFETRTAGGEAVRVHAPRHGFRFRSAEVESSNL